jgi:hypothetical protein
MVGIITLLFTCLQIFLLSDFFFPYISRILLYRLFKFQPPNAEKMEKSKNTILILEKASWRNAVLLMGAFPNAHIIIPKSHKKCIPWFHRLFYSFHPLSAESNMHELIKKAQSILDAGDMPCLFLENAFPKNHIPVSKAFFDFFQKKSFQFLFVNVERDPLTSSLMMHFSKEPGQPDETD